AHSFSYLSFLLSSRRPLLLTTLFPYTTLFRSPWVIKLSPLSNLLFSSIYMKVYFIFIISITTHNHFSLVRTFIFFIRTYFVPVKNQICYSIYSIRCCSSFCVWVHLKCTKDRYITIFGYFFFSHIDFSV